MNLVVGSSGTVRTEICRLLTASGKPVPRRSCPSSCAPAKVENLKRLGATVVEGNLRDPISLSAAPATARASGIAQPRPCPSYTPGENTPQIA